MVSLVLIVFVSMLGNSLLAPLIPFYAERLGASPAVITLIAALYAACQLLAAPVWGRLSDTVGRRPVLIGTVLGTGVGFIMLAYADNLWLFVLARIVGGLAAGNLAAAYAYVTDVTTPETRASGMGKVGAAFGLGFVMGPVLSGFLAGGDSIAEANFARPALAAAVLSGVALLSTVLFLKESRVPSAGAPRKEGLNPFRRLAAAARNPDMAMLLWAAVICFTAAGIRESIVALWVQDAFALSPRELGYLFGYTGLVITLLQGAALGRLAQRIGDDQVLLSGIAAYAVGLVAFIFAADAVLLIVGTTLNAYGTAVFSNAIPTVASKLAKPEERGLMLGAYQSSGSLGRFLGPAMAGFIYAEVSHTAPFMFGAAGLAIAFVLALRLRTRLRAAPLPL